MEQLLQLAHPQGTLVQDRYRVEELLGRGGFGAVYRVRDEQTGELVALKELSEQSESEKQRLRIECEILQRLNHPSLPEVHGVFEQDHHMYMRMEYIAGPNLEILRKRQPDACFAYSEVVALIRPIIEAVTYLHQQHPPLMHRDIKPANIIVPENGERTVLVDFGIAKEYHADATTTAIRHCSPGYSAPEQYSSMGTDPRVDVYGLGATCYTLLTGTPPSDALSRMTRMASKASDPLVPVSELVPTLPPGAAAAIQRALTINYEQRLPTPADFWQVFTSSTDASSFSTLERVTPGYLPAISVREVKTHSQRSHSGRLRVALVLLLILLSAGTALGFWAYAYHTTVSATAASLSVTRPHPTSTHVVAGAYPVLASAYVGTIDNLLTRTTINIALKSIQQSSQSFKGLFIEAPKNVPQTFSGVIDTSKHLLFTLPAQTGSAALVFEGTVSSAGNLVGNYCSVDASGQCSGGAYGLWGLSPLLARS